MVAGRVNASNGRGGPMVVERKFNVVSLESKLLQLITHSLEEVSIALTNRSLDPKRLAITDEFPFNPTYVPQYTITNLA